MAVLKQRQEQRTYLTMGANGKGETMLKQQVEEGTVGAIRRDWSVNGESGTKWELCFPSVEGNISEVKFVEKEFNKKKHFDIYITFDNEIVVTSKSTSKFGTSVMRLLPNVDLTKPVSFAPYSYIPKGKTKESTGVSIKQGEGFTEKIEDNFYDFDKKESMNGIPQATFDWDTVEEWESNKFWADTDKFLREYIIENVIPNVIGPEELQPIDLSQQVDDSSEEQALEGLDSEDF